MSKEGRVFVRGVSSEDYGLRELREKQRAAWRIRHSVGDDHDTISGLGGYSGSSPGDSNADRGIKTWAHFEPGDDPFLTQSLHVYFHTFPPGSSNKGHGHQNEACFYVLDGSGYDIHDGLRYDWKKGDLFVVHTDSVHRHFNPYDAPASVMIIKAKPTWMFLGLLQQGKSYVKFKDNNGDYGERISWSKIWTNGVEDRNKVVSSSIAPETLTEMGFIRTLASAEIADLRLFSVDVFEWSIPRGSRTARTWKMSDEILHVASGSGYSLQWDVEAELDDKYYGHVAKTPNRYEFGTGDTIYVPQNTVSQHFANPNESVRLISGQNRLFKMLGYDNVCVMEAAPEFACSEAANKVP